MTRFPKVALPSARHLEVASVMILISIVRYRTVGCATKRFV